MTYLGPIFTVKNFITENVRDLDGIETHQICFQTLMRINQSKHFVKGLFLVYMCNSENRHNSACKVTRM